MLLRGSQTPEQMSDSGMCYNRDEAAAVCTPRTWHQQSRGISTGTASGGAGYAIGCNVRGHAKRSTSIEADVSAPHCNSPTP